MNNKISVVKNDSIGEYVFQYEGEILRTTEKGLLLRAIFGMPKVVVTQDVDFVKGDIFYEYYLFGKWFNIYEVHEGKAERLKAWYCNLSRPMLYHEGMIKFDDLALDLLVYPDGQYKVLDREEFRKLAISGHERRMVLEGLEELKKIFQDIRDLNLSALL